jgi:hypothetical protein
MIMTEDCEKLAAVANEILRVVALMPRHDPYLPTLSDIRDGIIRFLERRRENESLAEEFSLPGTLKRFLLQRGFMPNDEADAEAILDGIIRENELAQ